MIDWETVQALHDEVGAEDFGEIIDLFIEEVEEIVSTLGDDPDRSTLGDDLHALKGSALSLGFTDFCALCQAGETAAENGHANAIAVEEIIHSFLVSKKAFLNNLSQLNAA